MGRGFTLVDYLMSGLAVFGLKYPSLLQFDAGRADEVVQLEPEDVVRDCAGAV